MKLEDITMDYVVQLMSLELDRSSNCACPVCLPEKPKNKTLHIEMGKGVFRCPRCETVGNALHLYGLFRYGYTKDQIRSDVDLFKRLTKELEEASGTISERYYKPPVQKETKVINLQERNKTYNAFLDKCKLSDDHYNNLVKRGLREKDIIENRYMSTPQFGYNKIPQELRKQACDLLGVPGFYKKQGMWTFQKLKSGFFIPVRAVTEDNSRLGLIQGMQIRYDTVLQDETRYKWWSTKGYDSGCAALTFPHFSGFPENEVYLTEGPLKGDIIYRFTNIPVVSIPGVNCLSQLSSMMDTLWKLGTRKIKIAFDMDYHVNINVQDAYINLVKMLAGYGFSVERCNWDNSYKGMDDWLLSVYLEKGGKLDTLK